MADASASLIRVFMVRIRGYGTTPLPYATPASPWFTQRAFGLRRRVNHAARLAHPGAV